MASATRVQNLFQPLIIKDQVNVSNLIYDKDSDGLGKRGIINNVNYDVIGFRKSNPFTVLSFLSNGIKFLKKSKSLSEKNILYNYDQPNLKNILFILYAKFIGYKIILDVIEDYRYYTDYPRFLTAVKMKSSNFLCKHSHYFADSIIAISDHLYSHMIKISKGKTPVFHIPITVDLTKFPKKNYTIPENYKIFYGGSFGEKDGIEYLIKAFEEVCLKFKNVNLILTGKGFVEGMQKVSQLIDHSIVNEKIIFKGFLSKDEYYKVLNDCDIFCMTRINSKFANAGFPFKLGEFLATGKAVIATDVSDVGKYIRNGENALLIKPSSTEDMAESFLYILENPSLINKLGSEGRKTAELYFDSEKVSNKLYEIFRSL